MRISPLQIYQAKKRIAPWVTRTPLVRAHDLSELCGAEIWSKLEILQPTGAFKLRGATNTILQLNEDERKRGVVASSTGNHGRAVMKLSLEAGKPVPVIEEPSLADSLGGGIGLDNQYTFQLVRDLVDETLLVSEDEIAQAMRYIFETQRLVVEGGAAVGVAALLAKKIEVKGKNVALVYSGNNVSSETVRKVLEG